MSPPTTNVVLEDGRVVSVPVSDLAALESMGARAETDVEAVERARGAVMEERFGGTGQEILTGIESGLSALTLGASDAIMPYQTRARREVNPIAAAVGYGVGSLLPHSRGSLLGKLSPAGLSVRAGEALGKRAGLAAGGRLVMSGVVEGGAQGAGMAVSRSVLSDDPLTVEAVLTGAGHGALIGLGLGTIGAGMAKIGRVQRMKQAEGAAEEAAARAKALLSDPPAKVRGAFDELRVAKKAADIAVKSATEKFAAREIREYGKALNDVQIRLASVASRNPEAKEALRVARRLGNVRKPTLDTVNQRAAALNEAARLGGEPIDIPEIPAQLASERFAVGADPAVKALSSMDAPKDLRSFATMRPESAAKVINGLRSLGPPGDRMLVTLADMAKDFGIKNDDAVKSIVDLHGALHSGTLPTAAGRAAVQKRGGMLSDFLRNAMGRKGAEMAGQHGGGIMGRAAGYSAGRAAAGYLVGGPVGLIAEVAGIRQAITGRIAGLIARKGESAGRTIARLGPATQALSENILGEPDPSSTGDIKKDAKARADEFFRLGPAINDIAYSGAVKFSEEAGNDFSVALAGRLAEAVKFMIGVMPRDPGSAMHGPRSDWQPSEAQAEELAIRLEAFKTPMVALDRILGGDVDPVASETMWGLWPGLMSEARDELIAALPTMVGPDEEIPMDILTGYSVAFRAPLDGLLLPENIARIQSVFIPRPPEPGPSGTGNPNGRPPKVASPQSQRGTGATMAQRLSA